VQEKINEISGCADAIVTLQTRQNQFKTAFYEWEQNKAKQASEMNASEYKKTVLQIINDEIVTYLRAMVQVNEEKYAGIHNTILQIINDQNIKVKSRLKKEEEPVDA
jgi:Mg2+ and Co2+ transporter CorA